MNDDIATRIQQLREHITALEQYYGRPIGSVKLLAVSKLQALSAIQSAIAAGQYSFAENYCQEAVEKIIALQQDKRLEWHFIGTLQSNKAKAVAQYFDWVHSVDSLTVAKKLSKHRPADMLALQVCLQVNIAAEKSKSGISLAQLMEFALAVQQMPRLQLRGLMTMGVHGQSVATAEVFAQLQQALQQLQQQGLAVDTLSMGMTEDYPLAIAAGATLLRIGSKIFGDRLKGETQ